MDPIAAIAYAPNVLAFWQLWTKRPGTPLQKVLWTLLLLIPVLGALLFWGSYELPEAHPDSTTGDKFDPGTG